MKALEKDRGRRYDSPNALADDIRRFLHTRRSCPARLHGLSAAKIRPAQLGSSGGWCGHRRGAACWDWASAVGLPCAKAGANRLARDSLADAEQQRQRAEEREIDAKTARMAEAEQRQSAEQERDKAQTLNAELQKQKEQQRRSLYGAQHESGSQGLGLESTSPASANC